jgi:hypothetical protein
MSKGSRINVNFADFWSGRWESNPRPKLGKLAIQTHCFSSVTSSSAAESPFFAAFILRNFDHESAVSIRWALRHTYSFAPLPCLC